MRSCWGDGHGGGTPVYSAGLPTQWEVYNLAAFPNDGISKDILYFQSMYLMRQNQLDSIPDRLKPFPQLNAVQTWYIGPTPCFAATHLLCTEASNLTKSLE